MDKDEQAQADIAALAEELRREMAARHVTQADIARETGLAAQTVHRYVNGKRDIPYSAMVAICAAIPVPLDEIARRAMERAQRNGLE